MKYIVVHVETADRKASITVSNVKDISAELQLLMRVGVYDHKDNTHYPPQHIQHMECHYYG